MPEFTHELIAFQRAHRVFRRRKFFQNRAIHGAAVRDIVWFDPAGTEMSDQQWQESFARSLGVFLSGRGLDEHDDRGQPVVDTDFVLLFNAHHEALEFRLPQEPSDARWVLRLDTTNARFEKEEREWRPGDAYTLQGRALAVFEAR